VDSVLLQTTDNASLPTSRAGSGSGVWRYSASDHLDAGLVTDAAGRFSTPPSPGRVVLQLRTDAVAAGRYLGSHVPVEVPAGATSDVGTIELVPARLGPDDERGWFGFRYEHPEDRRRHASVERKAGPLAGGRSLREHAAAAQEPVIRRGRAKE
jgi:hypothetical protein